MDPAFRVMRVVRQHRPRHSDHAVERCRQPMRLRQRLQCHVELVQQRWDHDFGAETAEVVESRGRIRAAEFGEDGKMDNLYGIKLKYHSVHLT